jgi:hypothetical protein
MRRRQWLSIMAGTAALRSPGPLAAAQVAARRGMPPLKIAGVKVILTDSVRQ